MHRFYLLHLNTEGDLGYYKIPFYLVAKGLVKDNPH